MKNQFLNLGKALRKVEQKSINGGNEDDLVGCVMCDYGCISWAYSVRACTFAPLPDCYS